MTYGTPSLIIRQALQEIGYPEHKSNADLYYWDRNIGSGNYTKYAYEMDEKYTGYFNGRKNGYEWCAVFYNWLFCSLLGKENALGSFEAQEKNLLAGCIFAVELYKNCGRWFDDPKAGDQIFFSYGTGEADHTGLVAHADDTYVYTIEGNCDQKVSQKKYKLTDSDIYGYGRPVWSDDEDPTETYIVKSGDYINKIAENRGCTAQDIIDLSALTDTTLKVGQILVVPKYKNTQAWLPNVAKYQLHMHIDVTGKFDANTKKTATENELDKGCIGRDVKFLQIVLREHGYTVDVDGDFGKGTETAVKAYQSAHGLSADGVVGAGTLESLLS